MLESPDVITIEDKEYKIEGFTQDVQSCFEKWWHAQELKMINDFKSKITNADYLAMLKKHMFDVKMGFLSFGCADFYQFLQAFDNITELFHIAICTAGNSIDKKVLRKWVEEHEEECFQVFNKLMASKKN